METGSRRRPRRGNSVETGAHLGGNRAHRFCLCCVLQEDACQKSSETALISLRSTQARPPELRVPVAACAVSPDSNFAKSFGSVFGNTPAPRTKNMHLDVWFPPRWEWNADGFNSEDQLIREGCRTPRRMTLERVKPGSIANQKIRTPIPRLVGAGAGPTRRSDFKKTGSRRRRGYDVDIPRSRIATPPRQRRRYSARRVAAPPRPRAGYSAGRRRRGREPDIPRGGAAAAATPARRGPESIPSATCAVACRDSYPWNRPTEYPRGTPRRRRDPSESSPTEYPCGTPRRCRDPSESSPTEYPRRGGAATLSAECCRRRSSRRSTATTSAAY